MIYFINSDSYDLLVHILLTVNFNELIIPLRSLVFV
jgi:hypothetical protein